MAKRKSNSKSKYSKKSSVNALIKKNPWLCLVIAIIVIGIFVYAYCTGYLEFYFKPSSSDFSYSVDFKGEPTKVSELKDFKVTFIDVGQGDSIYLQFPDGKTMLVDAGKSSGFKAIEKVIKEKKIDFVVATHSDDDHIGSMVDVYTNYNVYFSYRPYAKSTYEKSSIFESSYNNGFINHDKVTYYNYLKAIQNEKTNWKFFNDQSYLTNVIICDGKESSYTVRFLTPVLTEDYYKEVLKKRDNTNDCSPYMLITYDIENDGTPDFKMLLTGDAESGSEKYYMKRYGSQIDVDVLKIAHHGSKSSTQPEFVECLKPEYAVISSGENNWGHPKNYTLDTLKKAHLNSLYRTDLHGNVYLTVGVEDEKCVFHFNTEKEYTGDLYYNPNDN